MAAIISRRNALVGLAALAVIEPSSERFEGFALALTTPDA